VRNSIWKCVVMLSSLLLAFCLILEPAAATRAAQKPKTTKSRSHAAKSVPAPRDVIGFRPGDDRKLASWSQIVEYFKKLDAASDRVLLEELGKTTLGRPFVVATISSPSNISRLSYFKDIQHKLADPRLIGASQSVADRLIDEGKTIVLITCGIHSTEVGGNLVSMNIAHRLASDNSADTREILDHCIVLLVPSLNPDGVDIVKTWYDKTLGRPWEGTSPPELYHHYTGHDNNRDWYAFTQVETQMVVEKIQNVWHPQIVHDIHQQGESGSRFFIPPYLDPWEPNVPPIIQAGVNFMGSAMAWELVGQGKAGVVINGVYDAWSPARSYQHYHGGIRILSETASARLASPTKIEFDRLSPQIGVNPRVRSWNFPLVWPGGEWKLSNIVDYMEAGAFALMRNAARYRERWLRDFYLIGVDAVRPRTPGEPYAYLIPAPAGTDETALWKRDGFERLLDVLARGQVEVSTAGAEFEADGTRYPAGTRVIRMDQPYAGFAKTLLERQVYPDLREYPGGPPRRPYDVTAHTLPLLMGVTAVEVKRPFKFTSGNIAASAGDREFDESMRLMSILTPRKVAIYKSYSPSMDEGWTRWILDQYRIKYSSIQDGDVRAGNLSSKYDCIVLPAQNVQQILNGLPRERYPAEITGGIGRPGVEALKRFVEDGGTLVTLAEASQFAISQLGVPVTNVLEGVPAKEFYCPGSILRIRFEPDSSITRGAPALDSSDETAAWFEGGQAFEASGDGARVIARFGDSSSKLLLSGWLLGAEKIAGHGAIVEVKRGKGRIVMFAFRPQYRGQSIATLPFLFNAMLKR